MQNKQKTLLVVDDEQDILEFLKVILLSGKDGREIVKYLKRQEKTRHIPVIMFSAHPSAKESALQAGADDFVSKPFEIELLLNKIAQYLR